MSRARWEISLHFAGRSLAVKYDFQNQQLLCFPPPAKQFIFSWSPSLCERGDVDFLMLSIPSRDNQVPWPRLFESSLTG